MAPLAEVSLILSPGCATLFGGKLVTRWRHLYLLQIVPPGGATGIATSIATREAILTMDDNINNNNYHNHNHNDNDSDTYN